MVHRKYFLKPKGAFLFAVVSGIMALAVFFIMLPNFLTSSTVEFPIISFLSIWALIYVGIIICMAIYYYTKQYVK